MASLSPFCRFVAKASGRAPGSKATYLLLKAFLPLTGGMAARGILDNPAMYAGYTSTPLQCVQDWVNIAMATGVTCTQFHHHLIHMLDRITTRTEKRVFNTLPSTPAILEYLSEHYGIT